MDVIALFGITFVALAVVVYIWMKRANYRRQFQHIPGPKETWLLGNALQIRPEKIHQQLNDWSKQFGHVYKIRLPDMYMIFFSRYDEIWEMFHHTGFDLAGRYNNFRFLHHFKDTGLSNVYPDQKWKLLRKTVQKNLKQYEDGMKKIERTATEISDDMFLDFNEASDSKRALDPLGIIKRTAMKTIGLVVCGERLTDSDPLVEYLLQYEEAVTKALSVTGFDYLLLDLFPAALNLPLRSSRRLKRTDELRDRVARELTKFGLTREGSLMRMLHEFTGDNTQRDDTVRLNEDDVILTSLNLLLAGVLTSSATFYCLMNILAHRKDVQRRIWEEIRKTGYDPTETIGLEDRSRMPYSRAVIYEVLRYHSVTPVNGQRVALKNIEISGIRIPQGSIVGANTWTLHHDPEFWEDPDQFRPERFLDSDGNILPPDHPRRKHLLPFSSGVRVCPGEQFALLRLFIWLTNLVKRFEITPAENNDVSRIDLNNFQFSFLLYPPSYEIFLNRRSN